MSDEGRVTSGKKLRRYTTAAARAEMIKLYGLGWKLAAIAERLHCAESTVSRRLMAMGFGVHKLARERHKQVMNELTIQADPRAIAARLPVSLHMARKLKTRLRKTLRAQVFGMTTGGAKS